MRYPKLQPMGSSRLVTDRFLGYDHRLRIGEGEFYETQNLTTKHYPLMASRDPRGTVDRSFTKLQAIIAKDSLYWVDNGTLYANGLATGLTGLQTAKETQLVSMGAYICIFPDKKYINTSDLNDYGSMGAGWNYTGTVTYTMCHQDGTIYTNVTKSQTEPANPGGGDIWIDTEDGTVKEYSSVSEEWVTIETVYTRADFSTQGQISALFQEYDGVEISGMLPEDLNGSKILYGVGGSASQPDYLVLVGIQEEQIIQQDATVSITRQVPDMDFVCECQNRLWGCFYGNDGEKNVNELYCCALGDFRNWNQYLGVSTDSWRASRGSDGPFTGCINYLGTPTFFKENIIHPISVSSIGAHQVGDIPARGVQQGSHKSLAIVDETLYYKTRTGVVAYQGGMPADVSAALGEEKYYTAAAGVFGRRYYISMQDAAHTWNFFCYDAATGLWMREDNLHAEDFARIGDELYVAAQNRLIALNGTTGTAENGPGWIAETGLIYYQQSVRGKGTQEVRYISRFNFRLSLQQGASMTMYIEYDSSGVWQYAGRLSASGTGVMTLPVRPRRCDHLRLRMEGSGQVRVFSVARLLEKGSDV